MLKSSHPNPFSTISILIFVIKMFILGSGSGQEYVCVSASMYAVVKLC